MWFADALIKPIAFVSLDRKQKCMLQDSCSPLFGLHVCRTNGQRYFPRDIKISSMKEGLIHKLNSKDTSQIHRDATRVDEQPPK